MGVIGTRLSFIFLFDNSRFSLQQADYIIFYLVFVYLLLTEQEVCMGES